MKKILIFIFFVLSEINVFAQNIDSSEVRKKENRMTIGTYSFLLYGNLAHARKISNKLFLGGEVGFGDGFRIVSGLRSVRIAGEFNGVLLEVFNISFFLSNALYNRIQFVVGVRASVAPMREGYISTFWGSYCTLSYGPLGTRLRIGAGLSVGQLLWSPTQKPTVVIVTPLFLQYSFRKIY